ncbi:MAG: phosphoribulokinase, partial [Acidimicrobiales bacterium]
MVVAEPREFLVVEGHLALCSPRARACCAAAVHLDTPESLRRRWKLERDTAERGYREQEDQDELDRREPDAQAYVR